MSYQDSILYLYYYTIIHMTKYRTSWLQKKYIVYLFETLSILYPDNQTELLYTTPFQLIIAVLMSAQTTDKQVNKVTHLLFQHIRWPKDVITYGEHQLLQSISSINYYKTKAQHIYQLAEIMISDSYQNTIQQSLVPHMSYNDVSYLSPQEVYDTYGYWIGNIESSLTILPGVWVKTAKVILHCLYWHPVIAVDTHVHRVANRLWIVKTDSPIQTAKIIEQVIPKPYLTTAHHSLILFGRYHCTAKKPLCQQCPFKTFCAYVKNSTSKNSING